LQKVSTAALRAPLSNPRNGLTSKDAAGIRNHAELIAFLHAYATPSDRYGIYRVSKGWTIMIVVWVTNAAWTPPQSLSAVFYALSVVLIALGLKNLESCTHEAAHYTLFKTRALNNLLEFSFALPLLEPVDVYRRHHLLHHAALGKTNDPALQLYRETGVLDFPRGFVSAMIIRPLLGFHTLRFIKETADVSRHNPKAAAKMLSFWVPCILLVHQAGLLWPFCWYFLVPLFLVLPILIYWAEVLDHAGLEWTVPETASRNNMARLIGIFLYPNDEGLHQIHHLHPGVPTHRLREAYNQLLTSPWFRNSSVTCVGVLDSIKAVRHGRDARSR
jgi:fatty acid desaturase